MDQKTEEPIERAKGDVRERERGRVPEEGIRVKMRVYFNRRIFTIFAESFFVWESMFVSIPGEIDVFFVV